MGWQVSVLVSLKDRNSLGICTSTQTVQQLPTGQAQHKQVHTQAIALHSVLQGRCMVTPLIVLPDT